MKIPAKSSVVVGQYRERLLRAIQEIDGDEVVAFVSEILQSRQRQSTIFLAGNGGSASTVNHYAIDWMLGTEVNNPSFRVISLAESVASITATGNDRGFDFVFSRQLQRLGNRGDLLVLVSASGNSPNLLDVANTARDLGLRVAGITGFDGGKLRKLVDISVHIPTQVGDYGVAEDSHLAFGHMVKEALIEGVRNE